MSTKGTYGLWQTQEIDIHLYNEMHDGMCHLTITDPEGSYSAIDIIVANWMIPGLKELLDK